MSNMNSKLPTYLSAGILLSGLVGISFIILRWAGILPFGGPLALIPLWVTIAFATIMVILITVREVRESSRK